MTRVEFHCGRCRTRGIITVTSGALAGDASLAELTTYVVNAHRAVAPNCTATDASIQVLAIRAADDEDSLAAPPAVRSW